MGIMFQRPKKFSAGVFRAEGRISARFVTGLAELREHPENCGPYERLGLLYNQASIDIDFRESCEVVYGILGDRLTTLFGRTESGRRTG